MKYYYYLVHIWEKTAWYNNSHECKIYKNAVMLKWWHLRTAFRSVTFIEKLFLFMLMQFKQWITGENIHF